MTEVSATPGVMGGAPCIDGTRPVLQGRVVSGHSRPG
jgi:uncharacterized protein (DUF433 family)